MKIQECLSQFKT